MFSWIIGSSLKFRFLVVAAAAALLVFGSDELRRMPVDVFPEFAPPKVEVQTEGLGMTSVEIEELITIPIEDALRGTPGIDVIRSLVVSQAAFASFESSELRGGWSQLRTPERRPPFARHDR